jgi:c-di-GMP-binding flagellar brake protein YcgR
MRERRAFHRVKPRSGEPIEVQIVGEDFMDLFHAVDISAGGLGVRVPHRFEGCNIDANVDLVVKLPREKSFMARGVVRHKTLPTRDQQTFFGVEFTSISDGDRKRIEEYVRVRLAEGGEA